ncbi:hypothetical protein DI005_27095 [Prauserella sp. PE36]|uniref:Preprotein translocase YidC n=1 Tax=Prauserella endophytica TaxID=1592324 RepID=A0ABY2RWE1_9PSEU|nr:MULTISPECIES: hypothetical protein [Prauserella]PXY20442.1 hypothetical protein BAY59_31945 [Prauserella coralliicola]RBM15953.1 hypothetical protein DI005_27095 [Prauserella sp. PE36]TKG63133.1 hypothetical protein FCN18_30665 [Prauserella endophytica]
MSHNHDLVPHADVDEQRRSVSEGDAGTPSDVSVPLEADPADAAEQAAAVPFDEEDGPAPTGGPE